MILLIALAFGLVAGLSAGGSISRLSATKLVGELPLLTILILQLALPLVPMPDWMSSAGYWIWLVSFPALAALAAVNRRQAGMAMVCLGLLLNSIVIGLNAAMPVSVDAYIQGGGSARSATPKPNDFAHELMDSGTRLRALADVLPTPGGRGVALVLSPGDVLLLAGVASYIAGAVTTGSSGSAARSRHRVQSEYTLR